MDDWLQRSFGTSSTSPWLPTLLLFLLLPFLGIYFLLLLVQSTRESKMRYRFPPGPPSWPVVGSLPHVLRRYHLPIHRFLAQLAQQYGSIFFLRLGSVPVIVVSSPALAKELLRGPLDEMFANRPHSQAASRALYPEFILLVDYGPAYRRLRRVFVRQLALIEEKPHVRMEEISDALQEIQRLSESGRMPVDITRIVQRIEENFLSRIMFSKKVTDSELENNPLHHIVHEIGDFAGMPLVGDYIPFLGFLDISAKRNSDRLHKLIDSYMDNVMAHRRLKQLTANKLERKGGSVAPQDLLDDLMLSDELTDSEIKAVVWGVLSAGIETSSSAVGWAMAELMRHPSVLQRLQNEIKLKIKDEENLVNESDLTSLDYLNAVIYETLRLHPVAPLLFPHMSNQACEVAGYFLPKKTLAIVNVWAIGHSPSVWNDPEEFRPERFMGSGIDPRGNHFELLPFGTGRRKCAGISLGLTMTRLILTNLLRTFDWQLPPPLTPTNVDMTESGITVVCLKHPLCLLPKLRLPRMPTAYRAAVPTVA